MAFSDAATASDTAAGISSFSVLNICNQTIQTTLKVPQLIGGSRFVVPNDKARATLYSMLDPGEVDPGPLHQVGWAPLPPKPDEFPWAR